MVTKFEIRMAEAKCIYFKNKMKHLKLKYDTEQGGIPISSFESKTSSLSSSSSSSASFALQKVESHPLSLDSDIGGVIGTPSMKPSKHPPSDIDSYSQMGGQFEFIGEKNNDTEKEEEEEGEEKKDLSWPTISFEEARDAVETFFEVSLEVDPPLLDVKQGMDAFPAFMTFYNSQFAREYKLPLNALRPNEFNQIVIEIVEKNHLKRRDKDHLSEKE